MSIENEPKERLDKANENLFIIHDDPVELPTHHPDGTPYDWTPLSNVSVKGEHYPFPTVSDIPKDVNTKRKIGLFDSVPRSDTPWHVCMHDHPRVYDVHSLWKLGNDKIQMDSMTTGEMKKTPTCEFDESVKDALKRLQTTNSKNKIGEVNQLSKGTHDLDVYLYPEIMNQMFKPMGLGIPRVDDPIVGKVWKDVARSNWFNEFFPSEFISYKINTATKSTKGRRRKSNKKHNKGYKK